jgi:hypothetical protein
MRFRPADISLKIVVNALLSDLLVSLRLTQAVPYHLINTAFLVSEKPSVTAFT